MLKRVGSRGGVIALSKQNYGKHFNTKRMPWCYISDEGNLAIRHKVIRKKVGREDIDTSRAEPSKLQKLIESAC